VLQVRESGAGSVLRHNLSVESRLVAREAVGMVGAANDHQLGGEWSEPLDVPHLCDGGLGVEVPQVITVKDAVEGGIGDGTQVLGLAAGQVEVERPQPATSGEGPSWPYRRMRSSRRRAAWVMRMRCDSTAHAAASYGEWKPHGRRPGSCCCAAPMTGSRSPTAGHPRPSTSRDRNQAACAAAASRSPSPSTVMRAVAPSCRTVAVAQCQSASTRNTARRPGSSPCAGRAVGVKPSQKVRMVASDHGPATSRTLVCRLMAGSSQPWSWMVTA
jgi:hypothetical protein